MLLICKSQLSILLSAWCLTTYLAYLAANGHVTSFMYPHPSNSERNSFDVVVQVPEIRGIQGPVYH